MADQVVEVLVQPERWWPVRTQARADVVARYGLTHGETAYRALLTSGSRR